jgi:hypothetical protein
MERDFANFASNVEVFEKNLNLMVSTYDTVQKEKSFANDSLFDLINNDEVKKTVSSQLDQSKGSLSEISIYDLYLKLNESIKFGSRSKISMF